MSVTARQVVSGPDSKGAQWHCQKSFVLKSVGRVESTRKVEAYVTPWISCICVRGTVAVSESLSNALLFMFIPLLSKTTSALLQELLLQNSFILLKPY